MSRMTVVRGAESQAIVTGAMATAAAAPTGRQDRRGFEVDNVGAPSRVRGLPSINKRRAVRGQSGVGSRLCAEPCARRTPRGARSSPGIRGNGLFRSSSRGNGPCCTGTVRLVSLPVRMVCDPVEMISKTRGLVSPPVLSFFLLARWVRDPQRFVRERSGGFDLRDGSFLTCDGWFLIRTVWFEQRSGERENRQE